MICKSIREVRNNINNIDEQIVKLIALRGSFVKQAAKFKKDSESVKAPTRVEEVISKVKNLAKITGANEEVVENVAPEKTEVKEEEIPVVEKIKEEEEPVKKVKKDVVAENVKIAAPELTGPKVLGKIDVDSTKKPKKKVVKSTVKSTAKSPKKTIGGNLAN